MTFRPVTFSNNTFVYNPFGGNYSANSSLYNGARNYAKFLLSKVTPYKFTNYSSVKAAGYKFGNLTGASTQNQSFRLNGGFGENIVSTASQYLGYNEANGSYKLFTNGRKEAWCADFVSYVVKEAAERSGKQAPSGFGSAAVEDLRQWGKNNQCYLQTEGAANKSKTIAQNVKPGDVVIFKNGTSHTGIVKEVHADGSITTIEGNTSDRVAERRYSANDYKISGFVQLA